MEIRIKAGCCYQVINNLLNVTTHQTANMLKKLATKKGVVEISKEEATERGYKELANWSIPEHDRLYLINDSILVCLPK